MLSFLLGAILDTVVENLPAIEQRIGQAAFAAESERLLQILTNATLSVQAYRQRTQDLMDANDRAVENARKKPPTGGGNG